MSGNLTDEQVHKWLAEIGESAWVSLHYESPGIGALDLGEITGAGYIRQKITFSTPVNRAIWSLEDAKFTGLPQNRLRFFGIFDKKNKGMLRAYGELPEEALVAQGRGYLIRQGSIAISIG